jgi:hypothetical protein
MNMWNICSDYQNIFGNIYDITKEYTIWNNNRFEYEYLSMNIIDIEYIILNIWNMIDIEYIKYDWYWIYKIWLTMNI